MTEEWSQVIDFLIPRNIKSCNKILRVGGLIHSSCGAEVLIRKDRMFSR